MGDADGLDGERADCEFFLRRDFDKRDFVEELVLFQLAFDVGQREFGGVNGNLELAEDPGESADVVFMPMGKDDGTDVLAVLGEIGDVGYDDIYAEQLCFREHEAGIDHDDVVFPAECKAVHAEFAEAAEGDDFQFICLHLSGLMLTPAGLTEVNQRRRARQRGRVAILTSVDWPGFRDQFIAFQVVKKHRYEKGKKRPAGRENEALGAKDCSKARKLRRTRAAFAICGLPTSM